MTKTLLINDRAPDFWGTHEISSTTQYADLEGSKLKILTEDELADTLDSLKGKRILVYVHGLKNTLEDVLLSHQALHRNISPLTIKTSYYQRIKSVFMYYVAGYSESEAYQNQRPYDVFINYSWPSYDNEFYYYSAKEHAKVLSPRLADHLHKLSGVAQEVDVMAHSLGNFLLFEALSHPNGEALKLKNIYSLAASVPNNSLTQGGCHAKALDTCQNLFVFHCKDDFALDLPFTLVEPGAPALGLIGPACPQNQDLNHKLKVVNSAPYIQRHSDYFTNKDFFNTLLMIQNQELDFQNSHFQLQPASETH